MNTLSLRVAFLFSAILLAPAGHSLCYAQVPPDAALPEATERFLVLVPPREIVEIEGEMENADQARSVAIEAERTAQQQRSAAAARIQEIIKALDSGRERQKTAKLENKQVDLALLKNEEKGLEREKNMMEEREALRDAEIDLARKRNELATLTKQALDLERQLALKRAAQTQTSISDPESARAARMLIDLERTVLEAQKRVALKQGQVADGASRVVDRQLNTLKAQLNVYGGR